MKELDRLAPDQRAVLALVLEQDRSYEQVAAMLGMSEQAVRDRAHAALDALARDAAPVATHVGPAASHGSAPANGAARTNALDRHRPRLPSTPSSRRGGALLLGGLLAIVIVAAILISNGGKGSGQAASHPSGSASHSATTASPSKSGASGTNGAEPKLDKTLPMASVDPSSKAAGIAYVLSQGNRRAFYVKAEGMAPSPSGSFYAVWLYDSPSKSAPLGRSPTVTSNGRMEGGGPLPSNASSYHKIVVTRETDPHPAQPGEVVLSGTFAVR